jgi:DNA-binding NarL/FixJ family response regulator
VSEPIENIQKLTCLFGELMEATCALYNRLERGILVSAGHWQTPPDFKMMDKPDGHICYDVINKGGDNPIIIRNLEETLYNTTDPNVMRYGLRTYIGQAVKSGTEYVGSLCAVFQEDYVPTPEDINIMGIVAAALGVEEVRLGSALELKNREHLLAIKSRNLEELNTALKVLVKSREEDRLELEEKILLNVKKLVLPYIVKLKNTGLSATQKTLTEILENNVKNISSSFSRNLSLKYLHFTPQEIQVANLIKEGMTSKSIAELLHVSRRTIDFHRENIRTKLGMRNKKANLRTYLLSMS